MHSTASAAIAAARVETIVRASRYVGIAASAITIVFSVLDRRVGGAHRVDPPERCDQKRVQRLEADRLAAPGRVAGGRDRARDLRPLELVGGDRRRPPDRCLPEEQRRGAQARRSRTGGPRGSGRETTACAGAGAAHSASAPSTTRGSRSISRRTNRHSTPAAAQASMIASSRSRSASGIVTSTMSGASRVEEPGKLVRASDHRHAVHAPPPQLRVVVDEADNALAGRLAKLAHQAAAGAPRADDDRAPSRAVAVRTAPR